MNIRHTALTLVLVSALAVLLSSAEAVEWQWSQQYGTDTLHEYGQSVCAVSDGGYVVAGRVRQNNPGRYSAKLVRVDAAGAVVWERLYQTELAGGRSVLVAAAPSGGFAIIGTTGSTSEDYDGVFLRIDEDGDSLGASTFVSEGKQEFNDLIPDGADGYIVCGSTPSAGSTDSDAMLMRLDTGGTVTWSRTYGGAASEAANRVRPAATGGYVMAGTSSDGSGTYMWVIRLNHFGEVVWEDRYGRLGENHVAQAVVVGPDQEILVGGYQRLVDMPWYTAVYFRLSPQGDSLGAHVSDEFISRFQDFWFGPDGNYYLLEVTGEYTYINQKIMKVSPAGAVIWSDKRQISQFVSTVPYELDITALAAESCLTTVGTYWDYNAPPEDHNMFLMKFRDTAFAGVVDPPPAIVDLPDTVYAAGAYAWEPFAYALYIEEPGGGYGLSDIDVSTLTINGAMTPFSTTLLPSHPDYAGAVLQVAVHGPLFVQGYGFLFDATEQVYTLAGEYTDGTPFEEQGTFVFVGHTGGDVNLSGAVNVADVTTLVGYLFRAEPVVEAAAGDTNRDGRVNVQDIAWLVDYLF